MKLVTFRTSDSLTHAGVICGNQVVALPYPSLLELLRDPLGCQELDFELEIACVIGREGKNIALEEASDYIAGYTTMNDWSARDFQRKDGRLGLGPGKGKDFATSLGPCLVTPDELTSRR